MSVIQVVQVKSTTDGTHNVNEFILFLLRENRPKYRDTECDAPQIQMQVFSENMGKKSEPQITKCKQGENWTRVTFKPDLAKFNMTHLEDDVVALMRKRVVDMAGTLGKGVKVDLDGQNVPVKAFSDYVDLYMNSVSSDRPDALKRFVLVLYGHHFE